jgi:hypothetical protein
MRDIAHRGRNAHAQKTKLGSEESGSNTEIEGRWQDGSHNPEAESSGQEGSTNEKTASRCQESRRD